MEAHDLQIGGLCSCGESHKGGTCFSHAKDSHAMLCDKGIAVALNAAPLVAHLPVELHTTHTLQGATQMHHRVRVG